jgi:enoyl-CoA hydratase
MSAELRELLSTEPAAGSITDGVGVTIVADIAVVTLARPEQLNALNLAAWRRIGTVCTELASRDGLACVVLRGAGQRAFGAGADIHEFTTTRTSADTAIGYNEAIATALRRVADLPVPVIAMIGGLAVGGGCELAAACDVRLAATTARFGIPIGRLGVTLGYTETEMLVRLIGPAMLQYLLFSGELIEAAEALRVGLVQRVVEPDELPDETATLAQRIRSNAPVTMRAAKAVTRMAGRPLTAHDTELLTRFTVEAYGGPDLKEGVEAFAQRRSPRFRDTRRLFDGSA